MLVIPTTWKVEIKKIMVGGQSRQKVRGTPSQPIAGCGSMYPLSQIIREASVEESQRPAWAKIQNPI
jgi:hypothetical protein